MTTGLRLNRLNTDPPDSTHFNQLMSLWVTDWLNDLTDFYQVCRCSPETKTNSQLHFSRRSWSIYLQQAISRKEQWMEGTQRFEEPVSKSTLNACGGVPMLISPKYWAWREGGGRVSDLVFEPTAFISLSASVCRLVRSPFWANTKRIPGKPHSGYSTFCTHTNTCS